MSARAVVLDSGVLDQVTTDAEFHRKIRSFIERGVEPVIPAVVLAEAITGRPQDAATNQTIKQLGTVDTDEPICRRAGALRHRAVSSGVPRAPSPVDAVVAAHAANAGVGVVYTTDPTDLERLLADYPRIQVMKP